MSFVEQAFLSTAQGDNNSEATMILHTESARRYRPIENTIRIACEQGEYPVAFVRDCVITHKRSERRGNYYWASVYRLHEKHLLPHQGVDTIAEVMPLSHDVVLQYLSGRLVVLNTKTFCTTETMLEERDDALVMEHGVFVDNGQLCTFDPSCNSKARHLGIKVKSPSFLAVSPADTDSGESWYYDLVSNTVKQNKWNFPFVMPGRKAFVASTDGSVVWCDRGTKLSIHSLQLNGEFSDGTVVPYQCDYLALVGTQNDNVVIATRDNATGTGNVLIVDRHGGVLKSYPLDFSSAPSFVKPYGLITFVKKGISLNTLIC